MACPSFELGGNAASAALKSAAPAILRGFPPPADVNFSASGSLRIDVSPAEHKNIPLKLPNASLVRPAERQLPLDALIALLRDARRAHMALGNSRAGQARMPEACGHFARAVFLTPRDARPYTSLGRALRADGRAAEAEAVLEAARRLGRRAS